MGPRRGPPGPDYDRRPDQTRHHTGPDRIQVAMRGASLPGAGYANGTRHPLVDGVGRCSEGLPCVV